MAVGRVFKIKKNQVKSYGYAKPSFTRNPGVTTIAAVNGRGAHAARLRGRARARSVLGQARSSVTRAPSARSTMRGLSQNNRRARARVLTQGQRKAFIEGVARAQAKAQEKQMLRNRRGGRRRKSSRKARSPAQLAAQRAFAARYGGRKAGTAAPKRRRRKARRAAAPRKRRVTRSKLARNPRKRAVGRVVKRRRKKRAAAAAPKRRRVRRRRKATRRAAPKRRVSRKRRKSTTRVRRRKATRRRSTRRAAPRRRKARKGTVRRRRKSKYTPATHQLTANGRRRKKRRYSKNRRPAKRRRHRRNGRRRMFRRNDAGLMMTALKAGMLALGGLLAAKIAGNTLGRGIEGMLPEGMKPYANVIGSTLVTVPAVFATMKFMPDKTNATALAGGMVTALLHTALVAVLSKLSPEFAGYLAGPLGQGVSIQPRYAMLSNGNGVGEYLAPYNGMGEYFTQPNPMGEYFESGFEGLGNYVGNPELAEAAAGYGAMENNNSNHVDPSGDLDRELTLAEAAAGVGGPVAYQAAGALSPYEAMGTTIQPIPSSSTWVPGMSDPALWAGARPINQPQSAGEMSPNGVLETNGGQGIFG